MPPREQPCAHTSIITMLFLALWHVTTAADMTVGLHKLHTRSDALARTGAVYIQVTLIGIRVTQHFLLW